MNEGPYLQGQRTHKQKMRASRSPKTPGLLKSETRKLTSIGTGKKLSLEQKSSLALHAHIKTTCLIKMCSVRIYLYFLYRKNTVS